MLVVCTGTNTEVGKTWIGARVLAILRSTGAAVAARKPAQSFDPSDAHPTDAEVLAGATGESPSKVCPAHRWYPVPMAPPMAAAALGRPSFAVADLVAELGWPDRPGWPGGGPALEQPPEMVGRPPKAADGSGRLAIRWVEAVGGVRSPLASDGDAADLCALLRPQLVVLVADAGLGTINAVLLSVAALAGHQMTVVLNHYDPSSDLHRRNFDWLAGRCGLDVLTDPGALAESIRHRAALL